MTKREAQLKSAFIRELKQQCPQWIVLLSSTVGVPDRCITGNGRTTFWEFKHATPRFKLPHIQELMCARLHQQGFCRYVVWYENRLGDGQRTLIIRPSMIRFMSPEVSCDGFDIPWLVSYVRKIHEAN